MPTGYTAKLYDNQEVNFEEFTMDCARAFGALVSLRDDPESEIPTKFAVSAYYYERVTEAKERLEKIRVISGVDLLAQAKEHHNSKMKYDYDYAVKSNNLRERYLDMLDKVKAWTPPTAEHNNLKDFMERQLLESIDHDCREYVDLEALKAQQDSSSVDVDGYYKNELSTAEHSVIYSVEALQKEEESQAKRGTWVQDLRDSFKD